MEKEIETLEKKVESQMAEYRPATPIAMAVIPRNIKETYELATILSKSGIVPKEMQNNPAATFLAISYGLELNISPTQALASIMIVNNRASIYGDLGKALVLQAKIKVLDKENNSVEVPLLEEFDEDRPDVALKQGFGRCRTKRRGFPSTETRFSIEDAKRAGLWGKAGPWSQYSGRMLMFRARSWELRDSFSDVLRGLQIREEVEDYQILNPEPIQMPTKTPRIAQDAIVVENVSKPEKDGIVVSEGIKPPAVDVLVVDSQPEIDPKAPIDGIQRKKLFEMLNEAKIPIGVFKEYLKSVGIQSTGALNAVTLNDAEIWIVKNNKT
jgi:hypothetical protein